MSDQRDNEPEVTAEIVYASQDDGGGDDSSNYSVWLRATLAASEARVEALENRIELACEILFGPSFKGDDGDEAESWKQGYDESANGRVQDVKESVLIAAGNFLLRAFGAEYDPPAMIAFDPPPWFAAAQQGDPEDDVVCD